MTALGPHAFFIIGSYLATFAVIAALTIGIMADNRARKRELARLDHTPEVKYRRAWTMAEQAGRVFCSTLPSGKVWSWSAGHQVTWDHSFPTGWHHIAAIRTSDRLRLFIDGKPVAEAKDPASWIRDPRNRTRLCRWKRNMFRACR